jgi:hypothetical protein
MDIAFCRFWLRVLVSGWPSIVGHECVGDYRRHPGGLPEFQPLFLDMTILGARGSNGDIISV